jgi:hypothetical protein
MGSGWVLESMASADVSNDHGRCQPTTNEEPMITIIWIAMAVTVLGSIELLARAATSKRSAVEADERNLQKRRR